MRNPANASLGGYGPRHTKNIIDVGQPQPLRFTKSVAPAFFNNTSPAGGLIRGLDEITKESRGELETMIEDALLLSL